MTLRNKAAGADTLGADGDKGDVTVGGSGTTLTIDNNAVTYAKMQDVSAGDKVLGRITGAGDPEEIACTAAGRALLDDASAADQRTTLGLGTAAVAASGDFEAAGAVAAHAGAADPHTGYQKESEKGNANGYASLDAGGLVPTAQLPTSTLDINGLTAETAPATADTMPIYDASAAANRKVTLNEMRAYMQAGHCGLRLTYSTTTTLAFLPRTSPLIEVGGEILDGTAYSVATTDNLISAAGADAGAAMTTNTTYYIYVSNSLASTFPNDMRASTTAPASVYGGGTSIGSLSGNYPDMYLGTSGNALNWRFVGMARTNGSTQFTDSATARLVASYYNRVSQHLITCPGYSNGNTATSWTTTSTTWARANAGTGSRVEWISFGDEAVDLGAHGLVTNSGANTDYLGIGLDSTSDAVCEGNSYPGNSAWSTISARWVATPSVGYHYAELMVRVSAGTGTYYADDARGGAVADPYLTYLSGIVRG